MTLSRRQIADGIIRMGLALQVVFLFFVDWGTIAGLMKQSEVAWGHVTGLVIVNLLLLPAAVIAWRWIPKQHDHRIGRL